MANRNHQMSALAWMVCLLAVLSVGCSSSSDDSAADSSSVNSSDSSVVSDVPIQSGPDSPLAQAIRTNPDVKGWLTVPGTTLDEAVVQTADNEYYLRRDAQKKYNYAGSLFLDFRAKLNPTSQNLVIYGHNLGVPWGRRDEPNSIKFAQLLKFANTDFARRNPYLYFSTADKQYVYQIFAVYYAEAYTFPVEYHHESYNATEFNSLIKDSKARSLYNYAVNVQSSDRLLTLSTCSYKYGTYYQNPNQRFVVVGRLMRAGEPIRETAELTVNESPKKPSFLQ